MFFVQIVGASIEDLSMCPGFGPQKAQRLHKVLHDTFKTSDRKRKLQATAQVEDDNEDEEEETVKEQASKV